jgi:hypothetical protein
MFQTQVVENIETTILYLVIAFQKSCRLGDGMEKYGRTDSLQMTV